MQSLIHSTRLASRTSRQLPARVLAQHPTRLASSSYGNSQSGHQKSDAANPKVGDEHPGPEAPASKGTAKSSSSSETTEKGSSKPAESASSGGSPKIHHPESAAEKDDPEVRKHNEDMRNRSEQTTNQLGEGDIKVNKEFWKGDVGGERR